MRGRKKAESRAVEELPESLSESFESESLESDSLESLGGSGFSMLHSAVSQSSHFPSVLAVGSQGPHPAWRNA